MEVQPVKSAIPSKKKNKGGRPPKAKESTSLLNDATQLEKDVVIADQSNAEKAARLKERDVDMDLAFSVMDDEPFEKMPAGDEEDIDIDLIERVPPSAPRLPAVLFAENPVLQEAHRRLLEQQQQQQGEEESVEVPQSIDAEIWDYFLHKAAMIAFGGLLGVVLYWVFGGFTKETEENEDETEENDLDTME